MAWVCGCRAFRRGQLAPRARRGEARGAAGAPAAAAAAHQPAHPHGRRGRGQAASRRAFSLARHSRRRRLRVRRARHDHRDARRAGAATACSRPSAFTTASTTAPPATCRSPHENRRPDLAWRRRRHRRHGPAGGDGPARLRGGEVLVIVADEAAAPSRCRHRTASVSRRWCCAPRRHAPRARAAAGTLAGRETPPGADDARRRPPRARRGGEPGAALLPLDRRGGRSGRGSDRQ